MAVGVAPPVASVFEKKVSFVLNFDQQSIDFTRTGGVSADQVAGPLVTGSQSTDATGKGSDCDHYEVVCG